MKTEKEIEAKQKKAQELYDAEMVNKANKDYLETVAQVLDWVLGNADDPLEAYTEGEN